MSEDMGEAAARSRVDVAKGQIDKRIRDAIDKGDEKAAEEAHKELGDLRNDPNFQADVDKGYGKD